MSPSGLMDCDRGCMSPSVSQCDTRCVAFSGSGLKARAPEPFPLSRIFLSPFLPLTLSELRWFCGCLPRVEAAVLRRVSLRSCRGRVRVVRCEEETFLPTRRPQRVRSSRGGRDS
ncbi:hypothetical protein Taro_055326 [Colocasia esculenta]|uniref:Uncharacterized protein n=1 Tax=Colocasia esculenta TaxID=4460 RepID=A0A843XTV1_COLES|nr:hypothetical protein [Colocasia esculenta]